MLSATSFQITLLTGRNWQDDIGLYVLGGVFLAATMFWYPMFRLKPSVYVLSLPWIFFGLAFLLIGIPSIHPSLASAHRALSNAATWCYAVASAAGFLFFGLNFGEEAVRFSTTQCLIKVFFLSFCRVLLQRFGRFELVLFKDRNNFGWRLYGTGVIRLTDEKMVTSLLGGFSWLCGHWLSWASHLHT